MKKIYGLFLTIILLLIVSGCSNEKLSCNQSGGRWTSFSNSCGDSCDFERGIANLCSPVLTEGCDCGFDQCWNGKECESPFTNQYHYLNYLNISCRVPINLINAINNISWQKDNSSVLRGNLCEAVSPDCTAEYSLFSDGNHSVRYRVHFMGSPDDSYYLLYAGKRYFCR